MPELTSTTDASFEIEVLQSTKPVIVDFTAAWCGPRRSLKPALVDLANEYSDELDFRVVDVDANPELCEQYRARHTDLAVLPRGRAARTGDAWIPLGNGTPDRTTAER